MNLNSLSLLTLCPKQVVIYRAGRRGAADFFELFTVLTPDRPSFPRACHVPRMQCVLRGPSATRRCAGPMGQASGRGRQDVMSALLTLWRQEVKEYVRFVSNALST